MAKHVRTDSHTETRAAASSAGGGRHVAEQGGSQPAYGYRKDTTGKLPQTGAYGYQQQNSAYGYQQDSAYGYAADNGYAQSQQDANPYARGNYGAGATRGGSAHAASGGKNPKKKAAIIIGIILGVLLLLGIPIAWFIASLNGVLAPSDETQKQLNGVLTEAHGNQPFYVLVLGSDSREGANTSDDWEEQGDQERADVMMLVRVDPNAKLLTLVSIPRDTPYQLEDGTMVKINETFNKGGAPLAVKAASDITGVDISHYVEIRLSGLQTIVDALGGVEVYVDRDMSVESTLTNQEITIPAGDQVLNGEQAQAFVRERHAYDDAEMGEEQLRQNNVRTMFVAIMDKVLSKPIYEIPSTVLELARYVTTDMKAGDLIPLVSSFAGGDVTVYSCTGPSDGDVVAKYEDMWFCYPNPEGWAKLMSQVNQGIEPKEIDYAATAQRL